MNKRAVAILIGVATLAVSLFWTSCVPPQEEEVLTDIQFSFEDTLIQRIVRLQDLRQAAELYPILYHPNPTYRYLAARAFASFHDSSTVDSLARLLKDPIPEVREMAAFALGQTYDEAAVPHLIGGFMREDTAMRFANAHRAILEAVGKCGNETHLEQISSVSTYTARDTALLEGQALAIYRFGLREITNPAATQLMVKRVAPGTYPTSVALVAAHYLARIPAQLDSADTAPLVRAFERTTNAEVRMALALAVGKTKQTNALTSLIGQFQRERDYRVKCNILRALSNFSYESCRTLATEALRDGNEHVSRSAAQYLLNHSTSEDAAQWWRFAKDSLPTPIQVELYRVANRHLPAYRIEFRDAINYELRTRYAKTTNAYQQAAIVAALGEFPWNYRFLFQEFRTNTNPVVKTAIVEAIQAISDRRDFNAYFGLSAKRVTKEFAQFFTEAISTQAPGPVAVAAVALRSEAHDYRPAFDSTTVLKSVMGQLKLPDMIESYNELGQTLVHLGDTTAFQPIRPEHNHPIDWKLLARIGDTPRMRVKTNKGDFVLELWPMEAPGSVANLVALSGDGFFKDKVFHRVVANFVVQGGSPTGDAYGSLDFSIRSELTPTRFDMTGGLGMASAGLDTEGTQFFVTHSPTPHLDGKYSLFGRVVEGMEVVHRIQVGDRILSTSLLPK